jgi:peptidoglycan hydrolase CwlO-like protein
MTPEERFMKIENLLHTLTEKQVEFEIEHGKIQAEQKELHAQQKELHAQQKDTASLLKDVAQSLARLSAAQEVTEGRLQTLIEHVDRHEERIRRLEDR